MTQPFHSDNSSSKTTIERADKMQRHKRAVVTAGKYKKTRAVLSKDESLLSTYSLFVSLCRLDL